MNDRHGGGRSFGGGGFGGPTPPINVGEEIDVHIEAVGEKGDGLAKVRGFVLFVPGVKEGQDVRVKVTRVLRKVGFAEKVGEATGKPAEEQKEEKGEETAAEEKYEDTENFGEESSEESPEEQDSQDSGDEQEY